MSKLLEIYLNTNKKTDDMGKEKLWRDWAIKIFKRRSIKEIILDSDYCAYRSVHVVKEVVPFGGGFMFKSAFCEGCTLSKEVKNRNPNIKFAPCALLESPLFTRVKVKQGDRISLSKGLIVP